MENVIKIEHLTKRFGELCAVDDISFQVKKGELFGFLGVNGAGKSTTINMLCTLFPPTEGKVTVCGEELGKRNEEIRRHIGVVFQDNTLDGRLTIRQNLMIRGTLYEKKKEQVKKNLAYVTDVLDIGELLDRKFKDLSGGQKRRCEVARGIMNQPDILFLDEPTTGLDPQTRKMMWKSIGTLQKEKNMTVFLTTHYMEEAARAQYIGVMDSGRLTAYASPFELKQQYAYDQIKIVPEKEDEVKEILRRAGYSFKMKSNHISVGLENTLEAIPLLGQMKGKIKNFEVIQGTMDDVFLNITGKTLP